MSDQQLVIKLEMKSVLMLSAVDIEVGKLALMQDKHFAMKLIGDEVGVDVLMQDQQLADEVGVDVGSAVGNEVEDEFGFELDQLLAELLS